MRTRVKVGETDRRLVSVLFEGIQAQLVELWIDFEVEAVSRLCHWEGTVSNEDKSDRKS